MQLNVYMNRNSGRLTGSETIRHFFSQEAAAAAASDGVSQPVSLWLPVKDGRMFEFRMKLRSDGILKGPSFRLESNVPHLVRDHLGLQHGDWLRLAVQQPSGRVIVEETTKRDPPPCVVPVRGQQKLLVPQAVVSRLLGPVIASKGLNPSSGIPMHLLVDEQQQQEHRQVAGGSAASTLAAAGELRCRTGLLVKSGKQYERLQWFIGGGLISHLRRHYGATSNDYLLLAAVVEAAAPGEVGGPRVTAITAKLLVQGRGLFPEKDPGAAAGTREEQYNQQPGEVGPIGLADRLLLLGKDSAACTGTKMASQDWERQQPTSQTELGNLDPAPLGLQFRVATFHDDAMQLADSSPAGCAPKRRRVLNTGTSTEHHANSANGDTIDSSNTSGYNVGADVATAAAAPSYGGFVASTAGGSAEAVVDSHGNSSSQQPPTRGGASGISAHAIWTLLNLPRNLRVAEDEASRFRKALHMLLESKETSCVLAAYQAVCGAAAANDIELHSAMAGLIQHAESSEQQRQRELEAAQVLAMFRCQPGSWGRRHLHLAAY